MRGMTLLLVLSVLALSPGRLNAQAQQEPSPFASVLFTPEEIMQHRRAINLNDEQRDAITRLIEELQGRMVSLQWRLLDETEAVREALEGSRVDLDRVMDRFEQTMETEAAIKQVHLELLVRIKNVLTREQQETLMDLRSGEFPEGH